MHYILLAWYSAMFLNCLTDLSLLQWPCSPFLSCSMLVYLGIIIALYIYVSTYTVCCGTSDSVCLAEHVVYLVLHLHSHHVFITCQPSLLPYFTMYSTTADQASVRSRAGLQVHDACRDGGQPPVGWSEECFQHIRSWHTSLTMLFQLSLKLFACHMQ